METGKLYYEMNFDEKIDAIYRNFFIENALKSLEEMKVLITKDDLDFEKLREEQFILELLCKVYSNYLNNKKGI